MTGEEVARELIDILSVTLGIKSELLVAAMRDRASVNNIALKTISVIYPLFFNVSCIAHTLDHVGKKFRTLILAALPCFGSPFSHIAVNADQCGKLK